MDGSELTPWLIRYAYEQGAFPMTMDRNDVEWFQPIHRALFPIEGIHLSRTMRKLIRRLNEPDPPFTVTFNTAFEEVMRSCLRPGDNWISEDFIRVYTQIHHEGWGHSVEVWRGEELAGGLYGILIGSCFCAESMFHRATNASKVALWAMVEKCRESGCTIFDAQVMNPHLESLGAYPLRHDKYMALLEDAKTRDVRWAGP